MMDGRPRLVEVTSSSAPHPPIVYYGDYSAAEQQLEDPIYRNEWYPKVASGR